VKAGEPLLLDIPQGPYSSPQFMAYANAHRKGSVLEVSKLVLKTSVEDLAKKKAEAMGKAEAAGARAVASARAVLGARLLAKESATAGEAAAAAEGLVEAARVIVRKEEAEVEAAVTALEVKWDKLIEQRTAADAKAAHLAKENREQIENANKRKADQVDQAQRRVQEETIAKAARRSSDRAAAAAAEAAGPGGATEPRLQPAATFNARVAAAAIEGAAHTDTEPAAAAPTAAATPEPAAAPAVTTAAVPGDFAAAAAALFG